jgi:hypothetical protein
VRSPTSPALPAQRSTALALVALVVASTIARSFFAIKHTATRLFPDEYIYASLGGSLAHGHYAIRGTTAHFPAALQPLLTAPIWRAFSTATAYQVIQVENAILASLACVPVYLLSRYVGLSRRFSFACAAYSVAIPALVYVGFTASDPLGYLFALLAVTAAVRSLDRPTSARQFVFLALVGLAVLARVEYVVLIAAYLCAGVLLERKGFLQAHSFVLAVLVPAAVGGIIIGPSRVAGFYGNSGIFHLNLSVAGALVRWFFIHLYLIALTSGAIIVPGAAAGLIAPRDRRSRAFSLMIGTLAVVLLIAASAYSALGTARFQERYTFALLPLLAIAFGLYIERGRPLRPIVVGIALVLVIAISRLPLSGYTAPGLTDASPFLFAATYVQAHLGTASGSLFLAVAATVAVLIAVLIAFKGHGLMWFTVTIVLLVTVSAGATVDDLERNESARAALPADLTWIDDTVRGTTTAIATPFSQSRKLLDAMYWNISVHREVVVDEGEPSDVFAAPKLRIGSHGQLLNTRGDLLFDSEGTTGLFAKAKVLAQEPPFVLWHPESTPQLRLLIEGRYSDGWLGASGRLRVWATSSDRNEARISFSLVAPRFRGVPVRIAMGGYRISVRPGAPRDLTCTGAEGKPIDIRFSSPDTFLDANLRRLSVRLVRIRVRDLHLDGSQGSANLCAAARR